MDVEAATVPASHFRRDAMDHSNQQDVGEGATTWCNQNDIYRRITEADFILIQRRSV
jgi:hypothetical protein